MFEQLRQLGIDPLAYVAVSRHQFGGRFVIESLIGAEHLQKLGKRASEADFLDDRFHFTPNPPDLG